MQKHHSNPTKYAFVIAFIGLIMLVISNGLAVGGIPIFFKSVQDSLIGSGAVAKSEIQSAFAVGPAITIMLAGLAAPLGGLLIGSLGFRVVLTAGCILLGSGLLVYSNASSLTGVYLAHGFLGLSLCFIGVVPASSLVSAWFDKWRGAVLGIVLTGTNFGAILIPLIATPIMVSGDWRSALQWSSLLVWIVLLPMVLFLIKPETVDADSTRNEGVGTTLRDAIGDVRFWLLASAAALIFYCIFAVLQQFNLFMRSERFGLGPEAVRDFQVTLAIATILGKFGLGFVADHLGSVRTAALGATMMFGSTILLWFMDVGVISTFAMAFGFAYGGTFVILQIIARDLFGRKYFPRILGSVHFVQTLGGAVGLLMTGYLADFYGGDFTIAFKILAPLMLGAVTLLSTLAWVDRGRARLAEVSI